MHAQANAAVPAAGTAGGAEWRARLEDSRRGEAAVRLQAGDHKISRDARCPSCRGPVVIGATVRVMHGTGCGRRVAMVRMVAQLGGVACPSTAGPAPSVITREPVRPAEAAESLETLAAVVAEVRPALRQCGRRRRDRQPQSDCRYTSQPPAMAAMQEMRRRREQQARRWPGLRPWVVLRWFVSGCRVVVQGWVATVRGVIRRKDGKLKARLDFDDWPRSVHSEVPEWWALDYLIKPESASVAA